MGRVLKWIALILLALILLIAAGIGAALMLIDPNDYRDDIARVVERETGRDFAIEGDLRLSLWPWLGLEVGRTTLADDPAFGEQPFASIERMHLAVSVLPLLRREIVMDTVVLDGASIRLIVDEQGRGNWEQLLEQLASEEEEPAEAPAPEREPGEAPVTLADIGGLRLTNAAVHYEDRQAGEQYRLDSLNLELDRIRFNAPVPLRAEWAASLPEGLQLSGSLRSELEFDEAMERLDLRDLDLRVNARGPDVPAGEQALRVRAARISADLAAGRYNVPELRLTVAGIDLRAELEAEQQGEDLQARARLDVPPFDARALLQRLGEEVPETADPQALTRVGAQLEALWAGEQLSIDNLVLQLDDTTLRGSAKLRSFDGPAADFQLAVDAIDLDRYLPPEAEDEEVARAEEPAEDVEFDLPLELLRGLELNGEFSLGRLQVTGLRLADLQGQLRARGGELRLAPLSANLYDGSFAGEIVFDVRQDVPRLSVDKRLSGVRAGPLMEDLVGDDWVTGRTDATLQLAMAGNSVGAWLQSLGGQGRFAFDEGSVKGINIPQQVRGAEAQLRGRAAPEAEDRTTDFARVTGSFTARNGVIRNQDLRGESPLMRLTGEGNVNLVESTIDYLLTVNIVGTMTGADGRPLEDVRRVPIPVRIRGPLDDFSTRVDLKAALLELEGERLRELEREARERVAEEERRAQELLRQEEERLRQKAEEEQQRARERIERDAEDAVRDLLRRR